MLTNLGIIQTLAKELNQAEKSYQESLEIKRQLAQENPQKYLPDLAFTQVLMSIYYQECKINRELSIQLADEAITNLLPFHEMLYIQDRLGYALDVLRNWDIDADKYLEEKLKDNE